MQKWLSSILLMAPLMLCAQEEEVDFDLIPDYLFASIGNPVDNSREYSQEKDSSVFEFGLGSSINDNLSLEASLINFAFDDSTDTGVLNLGILGKARVNENFAFYAGFGLGFWSAEISGYKEEEPRFDRDMSPEERERYARYLEMQRKEALNYELDGTDIYMRFGLDVTLNEDFSVFLDFYSLEGIKGTESSMLGISYNF